MNDKIQTMVGDQMRIIDLDVFMEVHEELADYYRAQGLTTYPELDEAIVAAMPSRLAQVLDGIVYH